MSKIMEGVWKDIKEFLSSKLPESSYKVWIAPLTFGGFDGKVMTIYCPNQFFASWIREHYLNLIEERIAQTKSGIKIRLQPVTIAKEAARGQMLLPKFTPSELRHPKFCKHYTFEEFVVGKSNQYAYSACWAAAHEESNHSQIIYLYADSGLGKSHLAQAVGQTILSKNPEKRLCYLNANDFTSQVVKAIKNGQTDSLKKQYRECCDVLLLEEVHSFSGRERTQAELAIYLDHLLDAGKTILFTGNQLPRQLPKINEQLRSRLGSGLITSINPPDLATRRKIVQRKARSQGIQLSDEIVDFMARNLAGDIRRIESAVVGLVAKSSFMKRPLDLDLAKEVIHDIIGEPGPITTATIRDIVCRHFQLSVDELKSKTRKRSVALPRQVAMFLARQYTDDSLQTIGRFFNRDHATVIHSVKQIKKKLNDSGKLKSQVEFLMNQLEKERWRS